MTVGRQQLLRNSGDGADSARDRFSRGLATLALMAALAMAAALVISARGVAAEPAAVVSAARIGIHTGATRFVMDMNHRVDYRVFTLANPYRVVIDMPELSWALPPGGGEAGRGLIERYRYGLFRADTFRVVLDMAKPVRVRKHFVIEPTGKHGYRLVFDLEPVSESRFEDQGALQLAALPTPKPRVPKAQPPMGQMPRRSDGKRTVVIDPGHGGVDPGAIGVGGVYEKKVTLATSKLLKRELEASGRYHVVLTRERDIFIPLRERVAIARRNGAELFLSLHADSIGKKSLRGASVYTLSDKASDAEAAELANRENQADVIAGVDLTNRDPVVSGILIDMGMGYTAQLSGRLQEFVIANLSGSTRMLRKPARSAGFAVLKAPDVPSVLVELGFLSNRRDAAMLRSSKHQAKLAKSLRHAVDAYFASEPDSQMAWEHKRSRS